MKIYFQFLLSCSFHHLQQPTPIYALCWITSHSTMNFNFGIFKCIWLNVDSKVVDDPWWHDYFYFCHNPSKICWLLFLQCLNYSWNKVLVDYIFTWHNCHCDIWREWQYEQSCLLRYDTIYTVCLKTNWIEITWESPIHDWQGECYYEQ